LRLLFGQDHFDVSAGCVLIAGSSMRCDAMRSRGLPGIFSSNAFPEQCQTASRRAGNRDADAGLQMSGDIVKS
jgi:hypothetical protein